MSGLCSECGRHAATIHLHDSKTGKYSHLCPACLKRPQLKAPERRQKKMAHAATSRPTPPLHKPQKKMTFSGAPAGALLGICPQCAVTAEQWMEAGRLGCDFCYEHFSAILDPMLLGLHGYNRNVTAAPKWHWLNQKNDEQLDHWQEQAALAQNYELAIQIRNLRESGNPQAGSPQNFIAIDASAGAVILSSRIRMARNLAGYPFGQNPQSPLWSVWKGALRAAGFRAKKQHWIYPGVEGLSIELGEEDQLRLSLQAGGACLKALWHNAQVAESRLGQALWDKQKSVFAWSTRYGYLAACPSNCGTGLRLGYRVHLRGLHLSGEWETIRSQLVAKGWEIRPLGGEVGTAGNEVALHEISHAASMGHQGEEYLKLLQEMGQMLAKQELAARKKIWLENRLALADWAGRSWGILAGCQLISHQEALAHLSMLDLAAGWGKLLQGNWQGLNFWLPFFMPVEPEPGRRAQAQLAQLIHKNLKVSIRQTGAKGG